MGESEIEQLAALLGSSDGQERIQALYYVQEGKVPVEHVLAVIRNQSFSETARSWAIISLSRCRLTPPVRDTLLGCLTGSVTVRINAINSLAALEDVESIPALEPFLDDHEEDHGAWFEDSCTVAQNARAALEKLRGLKN